MSHTRLPLIALAVSLAACPAEVMRPDSGTDTGWWDDGSLAGGGGAATGGADGATEGADAPFTCTCLVEGDVCVELESSSDPMTCARASSACDALNGCDAGYTCRQGSCTCDVPESCGIACDDDTGCPANLSCDRASGVCAGLSTCLDNAMCSEGEACFDYSSGDDENRGSRCLARGSLPPGADCSEHLECSSGACDFDSDICLPACSRNADCGPGMRCEAGYTGQSGCRVESAALCTDCTDPGSYCARGECVQACETSADCAGGACSVSIHYANSFACHDGEGSCADHELMMIDADDGPRCIVAVACAADDECPSPTTCIELASGDWRARYCGRPVDP